MGDIVHRRLLALITGWALSLVPNAATVLAAVRRGIVVDPARGPFGGLPEVLRPDNGLEFAAAALRRSAAALGIELVPAPAYQGYSKGKVERANLTMDQEFLSGLPLFTQGPRAADGRLSGPDAEPMSLGLFCDRFAEWVAAYNTIRVHSELGETPLQRWNADATPLRTVPEEQLRRIRSGEFTRSRPGLPARRERRGERRVVGAAVVTQVDGGAVGATAGQARSPWKLPRVPTDRDHCRADVGPRSCPP
ncbi:MAG: hypothetical protein LC721_02300 [Actinobacteria bacterium]|nr:hypothetical protein [Actinomycetota bacterium]